MRLEEYLDQEIFCGLSGETIEPEQEEIEGFEVFMERYKAGLAIEKSAIENMKW